MISTRPMMVPPNVRTQCKRCFMFRMSPNDASQIAQDFGHGAEAVEEPLDTGECFVLKAGSPQIVRFNAFELVN